MIYRRIDSQNDPDISYLDEILNLPEISRFINVDKNNYWTYVTNTENVFYFKVLIDGITGYACVAMTKYAYGTKEPTLPISLGNYSLYFYAE